MATYEIQVVTLTGGSTFMLNRAQEIAAEADAEIAALKAEIARMLAHEASNKRALEAWLSGAPSRPPVTGQVKALAGDPSSKGDA